LKILILDDDKICRRVTSESLRRVGYGTVEASSAKEAFELLEKGEPIVMIVTDIRMPEMDGLDFAARLRSDPGLSKMPIIICTAVDSKVWLDQMEAFGVTAYSPKPINANHLRGKIGKILQDEPWPLEETSRSLMRLDIPVEDYFRCLDELAQQLDDLIARSEGASQPASRDDLVFELDAVAGGAQNLGANRISEVLNREIEAAKALADGQKAAISPSLKRETRMLKLAILILKKENEEGIAARSAGRVVPSHMTKEARWKTALVSEQLAPEAPNAAAGEPPATPAAAVEPSEPAPETPPVPSSS
jgi:CheY-like chemotaxis protein